MQYGCKSSHAIQSVGENDVLCGLVLAAPGVWFAENSGEDHVAIDDDDLDFPDLEQKGVVLLEKPSCLRRLLEHLSRKVLYNVSTIARVGPRARWKMCPERFK